MPISEEKKKRIENLPFDEMAYEVNLGNCSRFQRESFAYLKTCYESRLREINSVPNSAANPSDQAPVKGGEQINKSNLLMSPIGYVWLTAIGGVLTGIIIFIINKHLGVPL